MEAVSLALAQSKIPWEDVRLRAAAHRPLLGAHCTALIGRLAQELAAPAAPAAPAQPTGRDAWARWAALRDKIGRNFPKAQLAERLDADRRERG